MEEFFESDDRATSPKGPKNPFGHLPLLRQHSLGTETFDIVNRYSDLTHPELLFYAYFRQLPSIIVVRNLVIDRLIPAIETGFRGRILARFNQQAYDRAGKRYSADETQYVLEDEMVVELAGSRLKLLHRADRLPEAQHAIRTLEHAMRAPRHDCFIHVVVPDSEGLDTHPLKLPKPKLRLETHYNDDLAQVHRSLLPELRSRGQSGLFLFHGTPGSGKSTYIRHLVHLVRKKVVFFPPGLVPSMEAPAMTKFLINHSDAILVMEDAEEMLVARNASPNNGISMLLNLTDGLLGQSLGIQFIATFNTERNRIDPALLRNGRLRRMYEFKPLAPEKTRALLAALGHPAEGVQEAMTLADIYHFGLHNGAPATQRAAVGFGR